MWRGGGRKRTLQGKAPPSRRRRQGGRQKSQLPCSCLLTTNLHGGVGSARNTIGPDHSTFSRLRLPGYFPSRASRWTTMIPCCSLLQGPRRGPIERRGRTSELAIAGRPAGSGEVACSRVSLTFAMILLSRRSPRIPVHISMPQGHARSGRASWLCLPIPTHEASCRTCLSAHLSATAHNPV
jgi:hypothetical protein